MFVGNIGKKFFSSPEPWKLSGKLKLLQGSIISEVAVPVYRKLADGKIPCWSNSLRRKDPLHVFGISYRHENYWKSGSAKPKCLQNIGTAVYPSISLKLTSYECFQKMEAPKRISILHWKSIGPIIIITSAQYYHGIIGYRTTVERGINRNNSHKICKFALL